MKLHTSKSHKILYLILIIHLFFVILFFSSTLIQAQEYIVNLQQYGIENGLSHRQVNTIVKDERGFIWLGTPFGLNRFDGYEFKWWTKEKNGLEHNNIKNLAIDAAGDLWIITNTTMLQNFEYVEAISVLNTTTEELLTFEEKFGNQLPIPMQELGQYIVKDKENVLYFGTNRKARMVAYHPSFGFRVFPIGDFSNFLILGVSKRQTIWGIANKNHLIEISKEGQVLQTHVVENDLNWRRVLIKEEEVFFENSAELKQNDFYKIDARGIVQTVPNSAFMIPEYRLHNKIKQLEYNPYQNFVWVMMRQHLSIMNVDAATSFNLYDKYPNLIKDVNIGWRGLFFEPSGINWVGGDYGLYRVEISVNKFSRYLFDENFGKNLLNLTGLPLRNIACRGIYADETFLYINTEKHGFQTIHLQDYKDRPKKATRSRNIKITPEFDGAYALAKGRDHHLWIGQYGLQQFNLENEEIVEIPNQIKDPPLELIWAAYEGQDKLWIGGTKGLQFISQENKQMEGFDAYNDFESLRKSNIIHIDTDRNGQIWICSNTGLYTLDENKGITTRYSSEDKGEYFLPHDNFYHFHQDEAGIYWLATAGGGLIRWDKKNNIFRQFTKVDGLSNNVIYAIYEDQHEHLWLSSDYGIIQFDKNSFQSKTYLEEDGITHHEFNRVSHFQAADGRIYFGGLNGITAFQPDDFYVFDTTHYAALQITEFQQFDGNTNQLIDRTIELVQTNQINLQPNDRFFRLGFALLSYEAMDKIQYAYQIEGVDKDWTYQKESFIRMGRLPYGHHILNIKGQAADGQWSKHILSIPIHVIKPFYLQNWFLFLSIGSLFFLMVIGVKWRTWQYKQNQKILELEVLKQTETIRQQSEKLKVINSTKNRFYTNITHEFRTPLTVILGINNQLETGAWMDKVSSKEKSRLTQGFNLIERNGKKLLSLINQLLDLSKLDTNNLKPNYQTKEVVSFIQYVGESFESLAERKGVRLSIYSEIDQLVMDIDEDKLQQIIANLLSNAIKFTPPQHKIILHLSQQKQQLRIKVKDTGIGISTDALPHIFDRFYQVDNQMSKQGEGTGIGLALVKELVDLLNGAISVKSKVGKGTEFVVLLPIEVTSHAERSEKGGVISISTEQSITNSTNNEGFKTSILDEKQILNLSPNLEVTPSFSLHSAQDVTSTSKPHLLLTEDNPDVVLYIQSMLSEQYQIEIAKDGQEGIDKALEQVPDIIISDVMMPKKNGFELVDILKQDERTSHIPIILLTAKATQEDKLAGLKYGADAYLMKPFDQEELLIRLEKLLEVRHALQEKYTAIVPNDLTGLADLSNQNMPKTQEDLFIEKLNAVLETRYDDYDLNIKQIAQALALNHQQFYRKLKALTNQTPIRYLRTFRLHKAKNLLLANNDLNVSEVAYQVGFDNPNYFSRAFSEEFGKSPNEVKK